MVMSDPAGRSTARPGGEFAVLSFNIRHGTDAREENRLDDVADLIRRCGADIVALQEVDRRWGERSRFEDQAERLREGTGLEHVFFGATLERDGGHGPGRYGNALLSRYPFAAAKHRSLPSRLDAGAETRSNGLVRPEPRGVLDAAVEIAGQRWCLFATHLCPHAARAQLECILERASRCREPALILGDFNSRPDSRAMQLVYKDAVGDFQDLEWSLSRRHTCTYPAHHPNAKIDYILANRAARGAALDVRTPASPVSDHLPVRALFRGAPGSRLPVPGALPLQDRG